MVLKNRVSRVLFSLSSYHYYNIASCVPVLSVRSTMVTLHCCAVQQSQYRRELGFYCEDTTCIPLFHKSMHPPTYPSPTQTPPPPHPPPHPMHPPAPPPHHTHRAASMYCSLHQSCSHQLPVLSFCESCTNCLQQIKQIDERSWLTRKERPRMHVWLWLKE